MRRLLAFYLVYLLCAGVLPFLREKEVPEEYAARFAAASLYGNAQDASASAQAALIRTPQEGLDIRLRLIREAEKRIDLTFYEMEWGESTQILFGELLQAARRGVQVRILADGLSGGLTYAGASRRAALSAEKNIRIGLYNPPDPLRAWTLQGRMHDKYMIVDDVWLLLGGRNVSDRFLMPECSDAPAAYDRDILLRRADPPDRAGKEDVFAQIMAYMDGMWGLDIVRKVPAADASRGTDAREDMIRAAQAYREAGGASGHDRIEEDYTMQPVYRASLLHNETSSGVKHLQIGYALEQLIRSAKESVYMQSPYVLPYGSLWETLEETGGAGIHAEILTNSMYASPNLFSMAGYAGIRERLAATGITLQEYQGEGSLHAKTYIIDERFVMTGSYNLDCRSAFLDTEVMLALDSPALAGEILAEQDGWRARAYTAAGLAGRVSGEERDIAPPPGKGLLIWLMSGPARLLYRLL